MKVDEVTKERGGVRLPNCMAAVISQLESDKKHSAVLTYRSTLHSFCNFSGGEDADMWTNEVFTPGRLKDYEAWLRGRDLKWNTVSTYLRTLRAVYNRIVPRGSVEYDPKLFEHVYTKVESLTKRSLTQKQMCVLLMADFSLLPEALQRALGYFCLMFLLRGMPFIDLAYLRRQDLQGEYIVYCRHKTGKHISVRIPKEARKLFEEYRNKQSDSPFLFPILDGTLKDEAELYACYLRALRSFNKSLGKIADILLQGVKISSYTARHTWATLSFHGKTPIGIISQALGHSSIKVTQTYLKPFENERVDIANDALIVSVLNSGSSGGITYLTV